MAGGRNNIIFLPVVEIPRLVITTDRCCLRSRSNSLIVAAGTSAKDEDLLGSPKGVDGLPNEQIAHCVDDAVLIDTWKIDKQATVSVSTDVPCVIIIPSGH